MKRNNRFLHYMMWAGILPAFLTVSCQGTEDEVSSQTKNIAVNTRGVGFANAENKDNSFMVLFWDRSHSLLPTETTRTPFLASNAPQPVDFYNTVVYDTGKPYPTNENEYLHATGYAPGQVLKPEAGDYTKLKTEIPPEDLSKGKYDFLSCDAWDEVYRGSLQDPFSQPKNKLYFRHLAAKLSFYVDRDKESMQNKQYVRNVQITNLQMSIDDGNTWTSMYTPSEFTWQELTGEDFTDSYNKTIETVKKVAGNEKAATSKPAYGYKAFAAEEFAGAGNQDFVLKGSPADLVPINGMFVDSCYVCNPIQNGTVQTGKPIRLKMDISAEFSFSQDFPNPDIGTGSSTTDDITYTRKWVGKEVAIYEVDTQGNIKEPILEFKPGKEYRIYLHMYRSGVYLVAKELPWDEGGIHYVTIPGGEKGSGTGE